MKKDDIPNIVIYQAEDGSIELKWDIENETVWASLDQIAYIFGRDKSVISRHIKNIFKEGELDEKWVIAFFATTASDWKVYKVKYYNLDVIISVWYRVNSRIATKFRKWATRTLKDHIIKGYTINKKVLEKNYTLFQQAINELQTLSNNKLSSDDILELVKAFSSTWFSLDAFDKNKFKATKQTQTSVKLEADQLYEDLEKFKKELIEKNQATELFAQEKEKWALEGIFWNIFQTAFWQDVYPSIEEKAVHLLYFIVKNHPFNDWNKRSWAFSFIWLLQKYNYPFKDKITPQALTAITLLVATSSPKDKERMIKLITLLLLSK